MPIYRVTTAAYCGMTLPHGEYDDYADAQARLKARCDWLKAQGFNLTYHNLNEVEVGEPDDCQMIPDACGMLRIDRIETEHECRGCNNLIPLDQRYCEDCA